MTYQELKYKIIHKWTKLHLTPIRVFCLHHVSKEYNPLQMWECDWMDTDTFKTKVQQMRQSGVEFISLSDACCHIGKDWFRFHKYAVLAFDDGYASIKEILPWLAEQHIPVVLFINGKYLDGESWSPLNEEQALRVNPTINMHDVVKGMYLTRDELWQMNSPLIEIGCHGYEHLDSTSMSLDEYEQNVMLCKQLLQSHPRYSAFYAYTFGRHNVQTDAIVRKQELVPILVDGQKNYNDIQFIHREVL